MIYIFLMEYILIYSRNSYLEWLTQCVAATTATPKNDMIFEIKPVLFCGCINGLAKLMNDEGKNMAVTPTDEKLIGVTLCFNCFVWYWSCVVQLWVAAIIISAVSSLEWICTLVLFYKLEIFLANGDNDLQNKDEIN